MDRILNALFLLHRARRRGRAATARRGAALIIVLGSLIFLSALVVMFFMTATSEVNSAKTYSTGVSVQLLSNSVSTLAMGLIRDATQGVDDRRQTIAWASQPGMIRTYDSAGAPYKFYKLYSDAHMTGDGAFNPATEVTRLNGWAGSPAIYTDLNEPASVSTLQADGSTADVLHYPVVDPSGLATDPTPGPKIAGFSLGSGVPLATSGTINPVPMPGMWLYVLADGTIVAPQGTGPTATIAKASEANPIMGRIAFWTDDDTCKVNINTASEGVYWDTPKTYNPTDYQLARYQPAQKEYQSYPGHPATTSLSTVFPTLSAEQIYALTPRVVGDAVLDNGADNTHKTSKGGTQLPAANSTLTLDSDRLYTDPDELMFKPTVTGGIRNPNQAAILTKDAIERARFFLTANSRSPDVNLWNEPRIGLWPITLDPATGAAKKTPFDGLISLCETVNQHLYYFQRQDPNSPYNDLPVTPNATGVGRNRALLSYIRTLMGRDVPGFGGNFVAKFTGSESDEIALEMADYIRCVNLYDKSASASQFASNGQVVPLIDQSHTYGDSIHPRGFGRFPTVEQAALIIIGTADHDIDPAVDSAHIKIQMGLVVQLFDPSTGYVLEKPNYRIDVSGYESFTSDGAGMSFPASPFTLKPYASNFVNSTFYGSSIDFRQLTYSGARLISAPVVVPNTQFVFGGGNVTFKFYGVNAAGVRTPDPIQTVVVPFPGGTFPSPRIARDVKSTNTPKDAMTAIPIAHDPGEPTPVNYLDLDKRFRSANLPPISSFDVVRSVVATPWDMRLIAGRETISAADAPSFFQPHPAYNDVANSWAHTLCTGTGRPFYGASGGKLILAAYPGYTTQYKVNDVTSNNANFHTELSWGGTGTRAPHIPSATTAVQTTGGVAGDWDNGFANNVDGPFINKADEGNVDTGSVPYFNEEYTSMGSAPGPTYFSPNRMIPSAGMFGSLPTGVVRKLPWQTLLFRSGPTGHPGLGVPATPAPPYTLPPDHLILDWFNMPVVEPYAISEPLSTAGRINMNYQMVPFTYITRSTGVRAVLKNEKMLVIPTSAASTYKTNANSTVTPTTGANLRLPLNLDETLKGFEARFAANDLFRSASEICSLPLVPQDTGASFTTMETYWQTRALTGDNTREKPYATIYPRLTTKSNVFTVHLRVQMLKKVMTPNAHAEIWDEAKDRITGEYRGSQTIERYIDPSDTGIPDYATAGAGVTPIGKFYKFRTVATQQFAP